MNHLKSIENSLIVVSAGGAAVFPHELRSQFRKGLDKKFLKILCITGIIFSSITVIMSSLDVKENISQKEIAKLQERYATLVLNKQLPQKEITQEPVKPAVSAQTKNIEEDYGTTDVGNQKEETVQEKQTRKVTTQVTRTKKINEAQRRVSRMGIFAQITSTSGFASSSRGGVADLIGASSGTGIDNINVSSIDFSSGGLVTHKEEDTQARERRGAKAEAEAIEGVAIGKASTGQMASTGEVKATEVEKIEGEASSDMNRSYDVINSIMKRTRLRIVRDFERILKKNPDLNGKIDVKFTILPNGKVIDVRIIQSTVNSQELEEAVIRWIQRTTFPEIDASTGNLEVVFPFVFTISEG